MTFVTSLCQMPQIEQAITWLNHKKALVIVIIVLCATIAEVSGYLLGVRTGQSICQIPHQESPQVSMVTPIPAAVQASLSVPPTISLQAATTSTPGQTVSQSPPLTPPVNWKTYTNTKYGFSIKYPQNWFTRNDHFQQRDSILGLDREDFIFLTPDEPCSHCGGARRGISINVGQGEDTNSINYVAHDIIPKYLWLSISVRPANLDNIDGVIVDGAMGGGCPGPALYVVRGNIRIDITTECINEATISQVFASFKFTD
jgi:hypothetical protein